MGFVAHCKGYLADMLKGLGVATIHTRAEANANYQVPKTAVILVSEDATEAAPERAERFVGTKTVDGDYARDGRLHAYRSDRIRKLVLEASVIGPSEAWVDDVIEAVVRDVPRRLKQTGVVLEIDQAADVPGDPDIPGETGDVWMDISVPSVRWHDDESLLRNLSVGQVYVEFRRPCFRVERDPHYEGVESTPNLTTSV